MPNLSVSSGPQTQNALWSLRSPPPSHVSPADLLIIKVFVFIHVEHPLPTDSAVHLRVGNAPSGRSKTLSNDHQVAWLLQLDHEAPCAYRVRNATIYKHEVARRDGNAVEHVKKPFLVLERSAPHLPRNARLETEVDTRIGRSAGKKIPTLRLAYSRIEKLLRTWHGRVRLNDKSLIRVEEFDENRKRPRDILHEPSVFKSAHTLATDFNCPIECLCRGRKPILGARHSIQHIRRDTAKRIYASAAEVHSPHTICK